jgi:NADH:ubiquinone oxidoreductase subunit 6 (subunit J)
MVNIFIGAACLACALMAVREKRLLVAALWLAMTSALVSWLMYRLGALEVGVVELSVGAGLVTVLFVFAINIAGDEPENPKPILARPLAWVVIVLGILLLGRMILPALQLDKYISEMALPAGTVEDFRKMMWEDRSIDILLQIVFIFGGVMAVLGFLGNPRVKSEEEPS